MSMAVGHFDLEEHRKRLRKMTDEQLLRHGKSARWSKTIRIRCLFLCYS